MSFEKRPELFSKIRALQSQGASVTIETRIGSRFTGRIVGLQTYTILVDGEPLEQLTGVLVGDGGSVDPLACSDMVSIVTSSG